MKCGLAAPSVPVRMPFFIAKIPFTKCGCKQSTKSQIFEQVEAHSVTRAGSVLSWLSYEQLLSMFHEGMPELI